MKKEFNPKGKFEQAEAFLKDITGLGLRVGILILFAIAAWRLGWSQLTVNLSEFNFSDLLAMILALFAMGMSLAFYFKSTDSSNQFYHDSYEFTQRISEVIGRMEERFGERLKHLDEGYGRIESRFDDMAQSKIEIQEQVKETEGKEEEEKAKLEKVNNEMEEMLENLAMRAQLAEREKDEFFKKMQVLTGERNDAQKHIKKMEQEKTYLQNQLSILQKESINDGKDAFYNVLAYYLNSKEVANLIAGKVPIKRINYQILEFITSESMFDRKYYYDIGIIDKNGHLTPRTLRFIEHAVRDNEDYKD